MDRARQRVPTNQTAFHHLSVFDDFDAVGGLFDDGARVAADERVAPDVFAALDGFKQERFALFC